MIHHDTLTADCRNAMQVAGNNRRRKDIFTLPRADQELLGRIGYKHKISEVDKAIIANAEFLKKIIANPEIFAHGPEDDSEPSEDGDEQDTTADIAQQRSHHSG